MSVICSVCSFDISCSLPPITVPLFSFRASPLPRPLHSRPDYYRLISGPPPHSRLWVPFSYGPPPWSRRVQNSVFVPVATPPFGTSDPLPPSLFVCRLPLRPTPREFTSDVGDSFGSGVALYLASRLNQAIVKRSGRDRRDSLPAPSTPTLFLSPFSPVPEGAPPSTPPHAT